MEKLLKTLLIILLAYTGAWAQPARAPQERIHAAKMAYITDRLHLTEDQSMRFVPMYNEYDKEIRSTRHDYFNRNRGVENENTDDAAARQAVDDNLDYQQEVIEIKRKYNDMFLRIISPQQLADLYRSEREFKQILLQRLKQQHNGSGHYR